MESYYCDPSPTKLLHVDRAARQYGLGCWSGCATNLSPTSSGLAKQGGTCSASSRQAVSSFSNNPDKTVGTGSPFIFKQEMSYCPGRAKPFLCLKQHVFRSLDIERRDGAAHCVIRAEERMEQESPDLPYSACVLFGPSTGC